MADQNLPRPGHMATLSAAVTTLLAEAAGLPDPGHVIVWGILDGHVHDSVSLGFAQEEASTEAIAQWAMRFGAVITSQTLDHQGVPSVCVRARFTWQELVRVEAFALFPLPAPEAITPAEQDSEPVAATPF